MDADLTKKQIDEIDARVQKKVNNELIWLCFIYGVSTAGFWNTVGLFVKLGIIFGGIWLLLWALTSKSDKSDDGSSNQ